jgi:two-component system, OmpR family, sensor histidine kinase CiaH
MFESARLRLTIWYICMLMLISMLFSSVIYRIISHQLEGFIRMQNERITRFHDDPLITPRNGIFREPPYIDTEMLREQQQQLLFVLVMANVGILFFAGGAGYILAGRTLRPIQEMVDDQNKFIGNASHELRTPIATMRAEMEGSLLEKHLSDQKVRQLISSNLEELGRLQTLTNNLLRLAKVHHGKYIQLAESVDLSEVLKSAEKKVVSLAKQKHIEITQKIEKIIISGDKGSLTELFIILFDNAIKFSPDGSKISVYLDRFKDKVKISVHDQGIGIDPSDLPHIFERFYRADTSRSQVEGYGLGLSIAQTIVDMHNGAIIAKSNGKNGSTFIVELPL